MLEWERVQQREQAMAETYRVDLVCHLFSGTYRRVSAGERGSLPIKRDPDVPYVRDRLVIKEVVNPGAAVMAGQRDVHVMPCLRGHGNLPDDLRVHLVDADLGGSAAVRIRDVPGDRARQPLDQDECRVRGDEPVEYLARAKVEHVHHDRGLLALPQWCAEPGRRRRAGRIEPGPRGAVDTVLNQAGHGARSRGLDIRRQYERAVLRHRKGARGDGLVLQVVVDAGVSRCPERDRGQVQASAAEMAAVVYRHLAQAVRRGPLLGVVVQGVVRLIEVVVDLEIHGSATPPSGGGRSGRSR